MTQVQVQSPIRYEDTEASWLSWLNLKPRRYREIAEMLRDPSIKDPFKARIVDIMTSRNVADVPYVMKGDTTEGSRRRDPMNPLTWLKGQLGDVTLSTDAMHHLAARLCSMIDEHKLTAIGFDDRLNIMIVSVLGKLPPGDTFAEALFERFELNDLGVYRDIEEASGYNPFAALLWNDVDEEWIKRACLRMRDIIRSEQSGETTPRAEHERAYECYTSHLSLAGIPTKLHREPDQQRLSKALLAQELQFLHDVRHVGEDAPLDKFDLNNALLFLHEEIYKDLRITLVRDAMEIDAIEVDDQAGVNAFFKVANDCETQYPDMAKRLYQLCEEVTKRLNAEAAARQKNQQVESAVADALRS